MHFYTIHIQENTIIVPNKRTERQHDIFKLNLAIIITKPKQYSIIIEYNINKQ
jgi:hypothetical protein